MEPLLSQAQYLNTVTAVKEFQEGVGRQLHAELEELNAKNKHTSYISGAT